MSEYCLAPDMEPKPNNNAVLEKLFILELKQDPRDQQWRIINREQSGKCHQVMNAPHKSAFFSRLADKDVASCTGSFDVSDFISPVSADTLDDSTCVLSAPEAAYSVRP